MESEMVIGHRVRSLSAMARASFWWSGASRWMPSSGLGVTIS